MSAVPIRPADGCRGEALCDAFNDAFADYLIGPPDLAHAGWPGFLRRQGVDLAASRVAASDGEVAGFALVGRFEGAPRSRLATMSVRPAFRGRGLARALLERVVAEARERGDLSIELEVFEQNERALALYRSCGFEPVATLHGYERSPAEGHASSPAEIDAPPAPVPLAKALAWLRALPPGLLPYPVSAPALEVRAHALVAWRAGQAQLVFEPRGGTDVAIASLVDRGARQDGARVLARALAAAHPQASLRVPQLQRADLGGDALEAEGWRRLALHQQLLRRPL